MLFFEVAILKITIRFFKFGNGDSAHQPTTQNRKKNLHAPFFSKMRLFFQKSARVVLVGIVVELEPRDTIFGKCSHLREKGGVVMLLKKTHHLLANIRNPLS
jgi:hypothetical protein